MKLWDCCTPEGRVNLSTLYYRLSKRKFKPPERDKRGIQCEVKIEGTEEIDKLMKQTPNYTMESAERE